MFVYVVRKHSKVAHLKHFTLNAAKIFINSFPITTTVNLSLEGQKSFLEGHYPSLPPLNLPMGSGTLMD